MRLWSVVRTSDEILSSIDSACAPSDSLAACYDFDDINSPISYFADGSGHEHHLHLADKNAHLPWCVNMDDEGEDIVVDNCGLWGCPDSYERTTMWGFCALSNKPRLPGASSNYNTSAMEETASHVAENRVSVLNKYPGCGTLQLRLTGNTASKHGGALYYDSCLRLENMCFVQGLGHMSGSKATAIHSNTAQAGGAVFVECPSLGQECEQVFEKTNILGSLPSLSKVEYFDNSASAYGNTVATKPRSMVWHSNLSVSELVPGQQFLFVSVKLLDSMGNLVRGSSDILQVLICREDQEICTSTTTNIPARFYGSDDQGVITVNQAFECAIDESDAHMMAFYVSIVGSPRINKLGGVIKCRKCQTGQMRIQNSDRGTWDCVTCPSGKYVVHEFSLCTTCPLSATCLNGAPPMFSASKLIGTIEIELPLEPRDDTIRESLAKAMSGERTSNVTYQVQAWQIEVLSAQQQRRSLQRIEFQLVVDTDSMSSAIAQLKSSGVNVKIEAGLQTAKDEVWVEVSGQYLLRSCPPGKQLINTTGDGILDVNGQRCRPCNPTTYILDQLHSCQKVSDSLLLCLDLLINPRRAGLEGLIFLLFLLIIDFKFNITVPERSGLPRRYAVYQQSCWERVAAGACRRRWDALEDCEMSSGL